jgi:predicted nucleic acid-binding protein
MTNFFDANILLYTLDDGPKGSTALTVLEPGGVISVQVLNEFAHVARRKLKMELPAILEVLGQFKESLEIVPVTRETHERAMEIVLSVQISTFDANIVAAAELAGCDVLYTEDLNHGQVIGRVTIVNPFMAA